ncbi:hypothetical protein QLQ12_41370 [Actinoplanes sp. NEAU-A12]|uniref:Uncharacterized protein n=1 Tax=Actinoplanes sandaracinus TaxID=3045177 RepID=A0ABT6WZ75_9ACTN|nr:hypothetical protein [Actinoplanes sandaracinus]MDI6105055.1 hypothetical protein [Actinoplanes sandaracinus]
MADRAGVEQLTPQSRASRTPSANAQCGSSRLATRIDRNGSGVRCSPSTAGGVTSSAPTTGPVCSCDQNRTVRQPALCAIRIAGSSEALTTACNAATRSSGT